MKKWFVMFGLLGLFSSCGVQNNLYVWSNYKEILANYIEKPNASNKIALEDCLLRIISESTHQKKRVPPGIYLQYGQLMASEGKIEFAWQYYALERACYPESAIFLDELESKLK